MTHIEIRCPNCAEEHDFAATIHEAEMNGYPITSVELTCQSCGEQFTAERHSEELEDSDT